MGVVGERGGVRGGLVGSGDWGVGRGILNSSRSAKNASLSAGVNLANTIVVIWRYGGYAWCVFWGVPILICFEGRYLE